MSGVGVHIPMQDYKSPDAALVIWATLVNTQTHIQTDSFWMVTYYKLKSAELKTAGANYY